MEQLTIASVRRDTWRVTECVDRFSAVAVVRIRVAAVARIRARAQVARIRQALLNIWVFAYAYLKYIDSLSQFVPL